MLYSGSLSLPHPHRLLFLGADHEGIHEGIDGKGGGEYIVLHISLCILIYRWCVFFPEGTSWGIVSRQGNVTAAMADKERSEAEKILEAKLTQITEHFFNKCQKWMPKYSEYYFLHSSRFCLALSYIKSTNCE